MDNDMETFFNNMAHEWRNNPEEYSVREKLVSVMALPVNSIIADIGCGKGVMFPHILKTKPAQIIAVDISFEMIKLAKEHFHDDRIHYINGDILNVLLPALDAVIIFNAYPHILNKEALIKKLADIIKPNGIVFIAHSRSRSDINAIHKRNGACKLSVVLESAKTEAEKFSEHFYVEKILDNDELFFIKMRHV